MIAVIPCIPPLSIDCFFNAFRHVLGLHLSAYVLVPIRPPHFRSSAMGSVKYLSLNPMTCSLGHTVHSTAPEVPGEIAIHPSMSNEG